jgi:hypothetical protein
MQEFRTEITVVPKPAIDHTKRIITAGSCFADNIGQKLFENKFVTMVNPLGICYNPISIHKSLTMEAPDDRLYIESEGTWRHFDFHSKFSETEWPTLVETISLQLKNVKAFEADVVMLTYGTAWVYRHQKHVVANCHKRPSGEFDKILLTPEEIIDSFTQFYKKQNRKIILTLSPVRHIKDTLELNQVSKSVLRLAIHGIQTKFPDVDYFPAYEIVMDDLRDYRFYEADMIHPSEVAIDYIWNKFSERYFSTPTKDLLVHWGKVSRSIRHRAFHPSSAQHKEFLKRVLVELEELKTHFDVSKEIATIKEGLA